MRIDYHTHHERCGHAVGTLEQYVQRGIELGLDQLGLSDHMPLLHVDPERYYPEMAMPMEELPRYVEECLQLKEKYRDLIDIKVGLEGDYIEGYEREIEEIVKAYPWDYIIGSVHFLGEWDITDFRQVDQWKGKHVLSVYQSYYDAVRKAAATGFYDIMGHLDVIKRFGYKPEPEEAEELLQLENYVLDTVARSGRAMELNASGLSKPCAEMFPGRRMVERAFQLGIPVTLGSDSHDPQKLGDHLNDARALLYDVGYRELAVFDQRQRSSTALEPGATL
ncbi:histidinol-phosphatase HisJ [Paenibacillus sp. JX-17]|uniref:Histidinol-phosphatase n=1 Tax=Paenibacillus lacisoli TaxID=3064525 RepID=A0ABT9CGU8_9BACL|nr:histidinol-phosphatase HisJ [Paenibacillus sp. JX-17]MDO7908509.1 histidinol-phosphatase HisJ [Paenibacillus sp. JX-17]